MDDAPPKPLLLDYAKPRPLRDLLQTIVRLRWRFFGAIVVIFVILPLVKLLCYVSLPHPRRVLHGDGRAVEFTKPDLWSDKSTTVRGVLVSSELAIDDKWGFLALRVDVKYEQAPSSTSGFSMMLNPEDTWRIKFVD